MYPFYYELTTESGKEKEGVVFALDFSHAIDMIDTDGEYCPSIHVRPATIQEANTYGKR